MTDLPNKSLLTVPEAASFFRVSRRTIYLWINDGILLAEKYRGGCFRVPRESILDLRKKSVFDPEAKYSA